MPPARNYRRRSRSPLTGKRCGNSSPGTHWRGKCTSFAPDGDQELAGPGCGMFVMNAALSARMLTREMQPSAPRAQAGRLPLYVEVSPLLSRQLAGIGRLVARLIEALLRIQPLR